MFFNWWMSACDVTDESDGGAERENSNGERGRLDKIIDVAIEILDLF